jgi:hypothetical protein
VDRVARKFSARQTTLATPVSPEQSVVVAEVVVVVVVDELLELSLFLQAMTIAVTRIQQKMITRCFRFMVIDFFVVGDSIGMSLYTVKIDQRLRREKPIVVNAPVFGVNAGNANFF